MKRISFGWKEKGLLETELLQPISRLSVYSIFPIGINYAILWRPDGSGILIFNEMHDVAERMEVGVLNFEKASTSAQRDLTEETIDLDPAFQHLLSISKLIIEEAGTEAESGVVIKAKSGEFLLFVASGAPCFLEIQGVELKSVHGGPEYPIECYRREAFESGAHLA